MLRNYPAYFPVEEKQYTVEVYKRDGRRKSGESLVKKYDLSVKAPLKSAETHVGAIQIATYPVSKGYRVELHETYVTRKNILSGEEFQERYDTPSFCSPSSESYWST
jgi:hypothetical protein